MTMKIIKIEFENARQSSRKAIRTQVFAAVTKCDKFIGCGGWDGEIEKLAQDGTVLLDGCPPAEHLREGFILVCRWLSEVKYSDHRLCASSALASQRFCASLALASQRFCASSALASSRFCASLALASLHFCASSALASLYFCASSALASLRFCASLALASLRFCASSALARPLLPSPHSPRHD